MLKDTPYQGQPPYAAQSIERLALAVVLQAVRDVRDSGGQDKQDARAWLECDGLTWLETFDLNVPANFVDWVRMGCPIDKKHLHAVRGGSKKYS